MLVVFFEGGELNLVFIRSNGIAIVTYLFLQTRLERFEVGGILGADALPLFQTEHFLDPQIAVGPGTANHRAVIHPGKCVFTNTGFTFLDLQQP
ncbi:hypothetical protein PS710_06608 [Pseudomonas fluorescens]|uniref:Uncharacterized protein n=1 Tax=Pseudomonas fluorescens TaxID=294 RepID=A0A5E7G2B1_PSEFL|nr:hypothetical protein PS710_05621 [Pseudomonas fluorescens]VVO45254.1 hypothetical protein PS710_06608 [Pseudomonas fluorescens]